MEGARDNGRVWVQARHPVFTLTLTLSHQGRGDRFVDLFAGIGVGGWRVGSYEVVAPWEDGSHDWERVRELVPGGAAVEIHGDLVESGETGVPGVGHIEEVPAVAAVVGGVAVPTIVDEVEEVFEGDFGEFGGELFFQSSDGAF